MPSPRQRPSSRAVILGATLVVTALIAVASGPTPPRTAAVPAETASSHSVAGGVRDRAPVIVAAGDIADEGDAKFETAIITASLDPARVIAIGDLAYDNGTIDDFNSKWQPSWGHFDDIVWPLPGNHEYRVDDAGGFREYFGITGGTWWSRRAGSWLVIGLDSEYPDDAAQLQFLRRRLAENDGRPTVIAWHHPRYSSGMHGEDSAMTPLWDIVSVDPDVRIVLWGHDHDYEHLAIPVAGRATKVHAFVVGTGGTPLRGFTDEPTAFTVTRIDDRYGVLRLRLGPHRWRWAFVASDGTVPERGHRHVTP